MKASTLFVVVVLVLSGFLHQISAYSDCMVTCPIGCEERKNCNSDACVCYCECSTQNPPPSTTPPPPPNNPTPPPPSTTPPPPTNNPTPPDHSLADQYCSASGFNALNCMPQYLLVVIYPNYQFNSYCCQNLLDLQAYCIYGYVPPEVAGINFFQLDYNTHCAGN